MVHHPHVAVIVCSYMSMGHGSLCSVFVMYLWDLIGYGLMLVADRSVATAGAGMGVGTGLGVKVIGYSLVMIYVY